MCILPILDIRRIADTYDRKSHTENTSALLERFRFFNIRLMTPELKQALFSWVNADLLPMDYSIERLLELVGDWFREQKIEPPGTARLSRVLRSELNSFDTSMLYLVGKFNEFSTMRGNTKRAAACVWRKVAISAGLLQIAYRVLFSFEKSLD